MATSVGDEHSPAETYPGGSQIDAHAFEGGPGPLDTGTAREALRDAQAPGTPSRGRPATPGGAGSETRGAAPTEEAPGPTGGAEGAPGGPSLGTTTVNVSHAGQRPCDPSEERKRKTRRADRLEDLRALWEITTVDRVRACHRVAANPGGYAAITLNGGIAHWSGLCRCGNIWVCPVCSPKVRATRADEIARAVARHLREGGNAFMVTLTARHKTGQALDDLFDAVANGWRKLMQGRVWAGDPKRGTRGERDLIGYVGAIRSAEITWGSRNGWHPHLHVVLLTDSTETAEGLMAVMAGWYSRWSAWMVKHGYEAPSEEHGIRWDHVTEGEAAGEYIAKVQEGKGLGNELARGDLKSGRWQTLAPFEVLRYFRLTGDMAAIPIWQEYERATTGKRRKAMTYSRGLRKRLLGDEPERTDEEIADEEIGGEVWALLPPESMRRVQRTPGLYARLLDVAENGGFPALVALLTEWHLEWESGPDAPGAE